LKVVSDDTYRGQCPGEEVDNGRVITAWDAPIRVDNIRSALAVGGGYELAPPTVHGDAPILAVHDERMVAWLDGAWAHWQALGHRRPLFPSTFALDRMRGAEGRPRPPSNPIAAAGYWCLDSSTGIVAGTTAAARGAVDIALTAVDDALAGGGPVYALCRPPGHHAGSDYFGGFCFFNNVAIAARHARAAGLERVAVLDVDYHHGNGTQAIFDADASVLVVNLHADPSFEYPYFTGHADEVGSGAGAGFNLNLPLPPGTTDDAYLEALEIACARVVEHAPELLLVSLGVDGFVRDPIGSFALTTDGFRRIGARIGGLRMRSVIVQEGGYAIAEIGDNVRAFLDGFAGA
jgi:acetoin utilization deacetylase AcuC-like enzyme